MRAAQRKKFEKELREQRRELAASFKRNQEANRRGNDDGPLDLADTATELYTQEFNYSLSETERSKLLLIDQALERVDNGDYGECQECGEEISEARLKAIPWTPYCIECQEEREAAARRG